jgi:dihydrofolate reductase
VTTAASIEDALALAEGDVYVAGGAAVYEAALPYADEQLLSEIDLEPEGDTFYPEFDRDEWREVSREQHEGFAVVRLQKT